MPELPEVETVRRVIEPQITGRSIGSVTIRRNEIIAHPDAGEFVSLIAGKSIRGMYRRGKFLIIILEGNDTIVIHLRMTGYLIAAPADYPEEKHTHIIFHLGDGMELRFSDQRRFGRLWLIGKDEHDSYTGLSKLGLEPSDFRLNAAYLKERLGKRRKSIKECLLDQSVIAGIGNIYSDEILFEAGVAPQREARTLSDDEWCRLSSTIPAVMEFFTERNMIDSEEYLRTGGKEYRNTPYIRIYGHDGEPCPVCGNKLHRITIGGRGSTFCPVCQC